MSKSSAPRGRGRPAGGVIIADRAQLLSAAEQSIRAIGPQVSMAAIAAEAHVTKPILYRGIGDKDALVGALSELLVDRFNVAVGAAMSDTTRPQDGLHRFIDAYLSVVDQNRNLYLFVTAGTGGDDHVGQMLQFADRSAVPIAEQLAAQRVSVGADPAVARTWAYAMIGTLHFVTLWWLRDASVTQEQLTEHLAELLSAGLRGSR